MELWQQEVLKLGGDPLLEIISNLQEGQREIAATLAKIDKRQDLVEREVVAFRKAFPDGDIEGHRHYHDTMIEILNERRRLRIAIQEKTISGLIWSGVIILVSALWHYVKDSR